LPHERRPRASPPIAFQPAIDGTGIPELPVQEMTDGGAGRHRRAEQVDQPAADDRDGRHFRATEVTLKRGAALSTCLGTGAHAGMAGRA
jgi:hypothetical protein